MKLKLLLPTIKNKSFQYVLISELMSIVFVFVFLKYL